MENTNELRRGNYFMSARGPVKVFAILDGKRVEIENVNSTFTVVGDKPCLDVIELTEDWLLRAGCIKTKNGKFTLDDWIMFSLEESDEKPNVYDVSCRGVYITCISYLHQLQNFYSILHKGTELTIKQQ